MKKSFNPRAHTERDVITVDVKTEITGFNPRAHTERDAAHNAIRRFANTVSIHAPIQSATCTPFLVQKSLLSFNPRAHTERDQVCFPVHVRKQGFNPRAHTERDLSALFSAIFIILFQSTRPYRARRSRGGGDGMYELFQSTRPYRARRYSFHIIPCFRSCFNPRAHTERDQFGAGSHIWVSRFNPRAHTERDL